MTQASIIVALLFAFITIIKAEPPVTNPCDLLKGLKPDQRCLNSLPGGQLPPTPTGASAEEIKTAYAAICIAKDCLVQVAAVGGTLPEVIGALLKLVFGTLGIPTTNKCEELPDITNPPAPCSATSLSLPTSLSGGAETQNAATVLCVATECLKKNNITTPVITDPNGGLACGEECPGNSVLPRNLLDGLLNGVLCSVLNCILALLGGGGVGGPLGG